MEAAIRNQQSFHRSLHSVRRPPNPNKKTNAPLPPNPTRVYNVDRMNFREFVQMLTGATASVDPPASLLPRCRLREVAAAPSSIHPEKEATTPLSGLLWELMSEDA
ncbi:hypothetical protein SAY86_002737 [Trapa natans]|uniref:VQ domain-containing protein n=1 Tax=Trapa natans TaxID=22666 RepID=A0AAN7R516_TRANT|nr:hypothetical protein SAY86_002737 [Trapa natans]